MASREVVWTKTAAKQRRSILKYWVEKTGSSDFSLTLLYESAERLDQLLTHPYSGQKADYPDTRVLSLGHFSIFYKIIKNKIIVTAFWDNRQDPKKLIKELRKKD